MTKFHAQTWFLTGATGLVGSTIAGLLRENELFVIALVRESSPKHMIDYLLGMDVKLVYGDLLEPATYADYLPTCDVVVHAAAAVNDRNKQTNWDINEKGTQLLCKSVKEKGVKRLIHISSAGIYGTGNQQAVTEEHPAKPYGHYLESKYAAEKIIINDYRELKATIIRPPFIYGNPDHDRNVIPTLLNNIPAWITPRIWRKNPIIGFVHAEDISRLVLHVGSIRETKSTIYNVQSFSIPLNDLLELVNRAKERRSLKLYLPYSLIYIGAFIGELYLKAIKRPFGLRKRIRILKANWYVSTDLARYELGFEPTHKDSHELERLLSEQHLGQSGEDDEINIKELVSPYQIK